MESAANGERALQLVPACPEVRSGLSRDSLGRRPLTKMLPQECGGVRDPLGALAAGPVMRAVRVHEQR
jgi:hypothetical protein